MGRVFLDAEFNSSNETRYNVLCFSLLVEHDGTTTTHNLWMDESGIEQLKGLVESFIMEGYYFVAFAVTAEASALYSVGIDPMRIKWIDLQLEYRQLTSNNNKIRTGKHLIDGKVKTLHPPLPKWDRPENYSEGGKVQHSLASCIYRFLGIQIDTGHKDEMRDLILDNMEWDEFERIEIMDYCASDVVYLPKLMDAMVKELWRSFNKRDRLHIKEYMLDRGRYAALSAIMERKGYPVDMIAMKSFSASVGEIKAAMQREVNRDFPTIGAFEAGKSGTRYVQKTKPIRAWVETQNHPAWEKTDKGEISLSLEAFEKYYDHRGDQKNFGNRFLKYLRDRQSLTGFTENSKKRTIWDSTGSDNRVRPYMGIYGAQTSRSQPKATAYIPLKASWMRYLIQPEKGRSIVSIDYSQQEFLLAGLISKCKPMVEAYHSGDPYLYFAKQAGAVPWDGTKSDYPEERDKFKSTVLGIQFGMGNIGLAKKIEKDTGKPCTEDEAQELIDMFFETYDEFDLWREETLDEYQSKGYLMLPDGWAIWGDNPNPRSVLNFPIQGHGACIMRRGVANAYDQGLDVIMTLHDALYVECDKAKISETVNKLAQCMSEAVTYWFKDTPMEQYARCRLDPEAWGYDVGGLSIDSDLGLVETKDRYITPRSRGDVEKYLPFFKPDDLADLI